MPVRIGISACLLGEEVRLLDPFEADHYVAGIQYTTRAAVRGTAGIYRKAYRDYPVSCQIASLSLANVGDTFAIRDILFPMTSARRGQVDGVELFAELALDGVLRSGSFDYPVLANLAGAYRLSPRWEASTRLAYLRKRPFTPFDTAASTAQRRAVYDLARVNAIRVPDYFRPPEPGRVFVGSASEHNPGQRTDRHLPDPGRRLGLLR